MSVPQASVAPDGMAPGWCALCTGHPFLVGVWPLGMVPSAKHHEHPILPGCERQSRWARERRGARPEVRGQRRWQWRVLAGRGQPGR